MEQAGAEAEAPRLREDASGREIPRSGDRLPGNHEAPGPESGCGAPQESARGHREPPAPAGSPPRRMPQRHSVRGQVLTALRTALVGGELTPGEVYSAPALAERFGVSATPVREAMQQLAAEGAVEVVPNRGFRVARRTARDLAELAEVRALLEVPVMLELARTVPPEAWEELRPLAAGTVTAAARGDRVGYAEADREFHHALLTLTGNRQLAMIGDELHRRAQGPVTDGAIVRSVDLLADAAEHTALLDALVAGDLPVVEQLVREHFAGARRTR
ncbi:GntR family transcriptional regulator [Streptomyces sp. NPDC002055]|uniref:GntR family transcriptional regulator n=1 Tax=Streptomyces sp. NPDC002055 TaxID=3154534 RepID=UPI003328916E